VPAYLAIGRAKFYHDPPHNPVTRLVRRGFHRSSLSVLERLQAADGGFAGSIPQTAFVVMSLASIHCQDHPLVQRGIEFLLASVASDSSWRIEDNFAIWNSALAVTHLVNEHSSSAERKSTRALANRGSAPAIAEQSSSHSQLWSETARLADMMADTEMAGGSRQSPVDRQVAEFADEEFVLDERCLNWLLDSQRVDPILLTDMPAGGWGHSDSPGEPPNALATGAVLMALARWHGRFAEVQRQRIEHCARRGISWLLGLQNGDGGWATFYGASQAAPFGESGTDATGFALRALAAWRREWLADALNAATGRHDHMESRIDRAIERGMAFLCTTQRDDGSFRSQWFGNEHQPQGENPVIGTALVLTACAALGRLESDMAQRAARWLPTAQHANGGWGPPRAPLDYSGADKDGFRAWRANDALAKFCSVAETALAVEALLPLSDTSAVFVRTVANGLEWLIRTVEQDVHRQGSVIGFYFTKLWYHEQLYPLVFSAGALSRAARQLETQRPAAVPVG
jgi:squalene-hopene/tetraprenyl-beta-curcumene cyclase